MQIFVVILPVPFLLVAVDLVVEHEAGGLCVALRLDQDDHRLCDTFPVGARAMNRPCFPFLRLFAISGLVSRQPVFVVLQCIPELFARPRLVEARVDVWPGDRCVSDIVPVVAVHLPDFEVFLVDVKLDARGLLISVLDEVENVNTG